MNKKGQQMTFGVIIAIILGIAVFVFLIFGFYFGWGNLWEKFGFFGGNSNINDVKTACEMACGTGSTYDYCESIRLVHFGDGNLQKGSCKDFEGKDIIGLDVCDISCESFQDVSDKKIFISGKVIDAVTGDPLYAFLWGIDFDSSSEKVYSGEDGTFKISLDAKEGTWWFRTNCYRNFFYNPKPSYIEILDKDESGFLLKAPNYEKRILFDDFKDGEVSVDIGDFPVYASWSIQMRSLGEDVIFVLNYIDGAGDIEGFPHSSAVSGIEKPYVIPVDSDFYISVIKEDGEVVNSKIQRISSSASDYVDCGLVDVLYSPDEDSFKWTITKEKTYWVEEQ